MGDERSASAFDKRLGERVRARRLQVGMSQEHLADILGITFQQVQKYEKGVNRIAASRLCDIARALEVPVAQFFEDVAQSMRHRIGASGWQTDPMHTPEGAELLSIFSRVRSRSQRRRILDVVRAMAEASKR